MIKQAVRHQKKLRMALIGSSGSGKTKTALELALGLANGGKIGMIDTEHGRGSLYANRYDYGVIELSNFDPNNYIRAIDEFVAEGYEVLIVDSMSHAWMGVGGVLDKVNASNGNSFTDGWGKIGTPLQNKLIEKLLSAPLHIIVSIRQKTEYVVEVNERGKSIPKKIGLAPVQRNDVEYEFDFVGLMDMTHTLTVEKSYDDNLPVGTVISMPTRQVSERLLSWLQQGAAPEPKQEPARVAPEPKQEPYQVPPARTAPRDVFLARAEALGMNKIAAEIAKRHIAAKSTWAAALTELNALAPETEPDEQNEAG